MESLTPADVKRWDSGAIHAVFETASGRAATLQRLGDNLGQVYSVLADWQGEAGQAFRGDVGKVRRDIEADGHESTRVAAAWDAMTFGLSESDKTALTWQVNEQFLRSQMEDHVSRIEYILPDGFNSVDEIAPTRPETYSAFEINFLNENAAKFGYRRSGNTWVYEGK